MASHGEPRFALDSDERLHGDVVSAAVEHPYARDKMDSGTSERTRGLANAPSAPRDAATVDVKFLERSGNHWQDVLRPAECVMDYQEYRKRASAAWEPFLQLLGISKNFFAVARHLEEADGTLIPLPWPVSKHLRLTSTSMLNYSGTIESLRKNYPVLGGEELEAVGVVLSRGQSLYSSTNHPVVLLSVSGIVYVHIRAQPVWCPDFDPETDQERLYMVADDLRSFAKEGLVRCDDMYTEEGGVPYCAPEDDDLRELMKIAKCGPYRFLKNLDAMGERHYFINGCPGMLKDRVFVAPTEVPSYVKRMMAESYGKHFHIIGRVTRSSDDPVYDCECYIMIDERSRVHSYVPECGKVRFLAKNLDQFMRIGTRRAYYNFQLAHREMPPVYDEPTFHPPIGCGFFLLSREMITVRRVR